MHPVCTAAEIKGRNSEPCLLSTYCDSEDAGDSICIQCDINKHDFSYIFFFMFKRLNVAPASFSWE